LRKQQDIFSRAKTQNQIKPVVHIEAAMGRYGPKPAGECSGTKSESGCLKAESFLALQILPSVLIFLDRPKTTIA
jgi:hypothetical protein